MTSHWIRKTLLFACATLASSLILSFGVGEFIIRHVNPQRTFAEVQKEGLRVFAESDIIPFTLLPNTRSNHLGYTREFDHGVTINNVGLRRDTDLAMPKPEGTYRILLLGDSMVFGWGVEDDQTFAAELERILNTESGFSAKRIEVEVLNAGFAAGFTVDGYYAYLVNVGKSFEPDMVVVSFFPYNDIKELLDTSWGKTDKESLPLAVTLPEAAIRNRRLTTRAPSEWKYVIPGFRNSHVAMLFAQALQRYSPATVERIKNIFGVREDPARVSDDDNRRCLFENICDERMSKMKERAKLVLNGIGRRSKELGSEFFVLMLAEKSQTDPISLLSEKKRSEALSVAQPQKEFREFFRSKNIVYVDLLPTLSDNVTEKYFFERDGHLNARGHPHVAVVIANFIDSRFTLTKNFSE